MRIGIDIGGTHRDAFVIDGVRVLADVDFVRLESL